MRRDTPGKLPALGRRTLLTSGVVTAAALGLGLTGDGDSTPDAGVVTPLSTEPDVYVERVHSQARNRDVDLVTMYPHGVPHQGLPVCLMLHGRYGDARKSAGGLPGWLSEAVGSGLPPFAFLAVDGGANSYWHRHEGDDPMWMLLDEVPRWLAERNLGGAHGQPFAVSGISMGGFGALVYARRRRERGLPLRAAAVVSPALITDWPEMRKRQAFTSEREWAALDPLRHIPALGSVPLGVWCGTKDRFIVGTRRFIERAHPEVASTELGGHNSRYYRQVLPDVVKFVGRHLNDPPPASPPPPHTGRSLPGE